MKLLDYAETSSIIPCPTLCYLDLYSSPILENVDHIIAPLTLAFPSLSQLSLGELEAVYYDRWRAVRKVLGLIMAENESREYHSHQLI